VEALVARLRRMATLGVTTVEVKSGYGLEPEHERKQLRAIARAAASRDVPAVVPTFLALHALPPSADRAAYVTRVARELVPEVAREGLARFVDAYVDANAFTVEEARAVGEAARGRGLGMRLHVGQFADIGGAELAAELGAIVNTAHVFGTSATPVTQLTDAVGSFAGLAEAAGVGLAIEFVPGTGIPDLATATAIVTAVGTRRVGIMFDTWHFYRSGGTLDDLAAVPAEHIVAINLSDATAADLGGGHVPGTNRRLPGDGDLPLAHMLTLLLAGRPGLRAAVEAPTAELRGLSLPRAALRARQALSALVDQVS